MKSSTGSSGHWENLHTDNPVWEAESLEWTASLWDVVRGSQCHSPCPFSRASLYLGFQAMHSTQNVAGLWEEDGTAQKWHHFDTWKTVIHLFHRYMDFCKYAAHKSLDSVWRSSLVVSDPRHSANWPVWFPYKPRAGGTGEHLVGLRKCPVF